MPNSFFSFFAAALGLSLAVGVAHAAPNGVQDLGTNAFSDAGATLVGTDYVVSGSRILDQAVTAPGRGGYLASTSTAQETITVSANNSTVGSFELTAITFEEYIPAASYHVWIVGNVKGGGTIGAQANLVAGTNTANNYATARTSAFDGVQLTSFVVYFDEQTVNGAENLSLRSFTTAGAQAPDTTPPTVTGVSSSTANGAYNLGDIVSIQVGFSESVSVTGTPQLTLETGATDRVVSYASGTGSSSLTFNYTVQAGDTSADLDYVSTSALALNGGTIRDAASNNATLTLPAPGAANSLGANKALVIDTTAPAISISAPSTSLTASGDVTYTVTYTDTNFSGSTLAPGNITLNAVGASASIGVFGGGASRTVTLSSITGNGSLGITIAAGTATDTAGNTAPAAGPSGTFTVDNTAPVITSGATASATYRTTGPGYAITATGGATSYGATGLPTGLGVNSGTGVITGLPTQSGTFNPTITATDAAGNIASTGLTLTVAKVALTISGLTTSDKTYDGGTTAILGGSASLTGVLGGDSVSLTGTPAANFATATVGTDKTVSITGYTLTGAQSVNYTLTLPSALADITAAGLTVSGATASNKTYDGGTSATLNLGSAALVGVVGADNVTLVTGSASGAFDNENVGPAKTVTVTGLALGGTHAANYSLAQPTTTASITAAGLTVTGVTASDKAYDGGTLASLNLGSASLVGVIGGDDVTLVTGSAAGAFSDKNVGPAKPVTVSGLALGGTESGNYSLTQPVATAAINAVQLTVSAQNKTRPYGVSNPTLTAAITGFVGGDDSSVLTGSPTLGTTASVSSAVGSYPITAALGTLSTTNYTFTFADGTLTVRLLEIADWEEENFSPEELLDPDVSGPTADPDLDGVTNLYEFAFGTDPNDIGSGPDPLVYTGTFAGSGVLSEAGQPVARTETTPVNSTRLLFIRRASALTADVSYTVQFSSNGTSWVTSSATPTVLADDGLLQVVSVPYPSLTSGKRTRFHRVVVNIVE
ncbi:MAG: putative Ig domain-containing protein [Burkholderiales bacterium]|nr:putative Ig domain-containing protein [Opitutaceae bacterium]